MTPWKLKMTQTRTKMPWKQKMQRMRTTTLWPSNLLRTRADSNYTSGDKSSTDNAADRATSISVDNLAAEIANATNAHHPAPTPLHTTVTDAYEASWNLGDTKQMATFVRATEPDSNHVRFDVGVPNASTLMDLVNNKTSLYRWDHLMNVPVEGTGVIDLLPRFSLTVPKSVTPGLPSS